MLKTVPYLTEWLDAECHLGVFSGSCKLSNYSKVFWTVIIQTGELYGSTSDK